MVKQRNMLMQVLLRLSDLGVVAVAWVLAYGVNVVGSHPVSFEPAFLWRNLLPWASLSLVLAVLVYQRMGLYEPQRMRNLANEAFRLIEAAVVVWMITYVIAGFSTSGHVSRRLMVVFLASWIALAVADRLAARLVLRWFRRRGWNMRYAAIVGAGRLAQRLYQVINQNPWTGIQILYFVDDARTNRKIFGLDVVGPRSQIGSLLAARSVDIVFVALPANQQKEIEAVLSDLAMTNVNVQVVADMLSFHFLRHDVTQLGDLPVIELTHSPQHGWHSLLKRVLDVLGSILAILVFAIPMAFIAVAIKVSGRGPIIYRQTRSSWSGKPFTILKFRTMVDHAEGRGKVEGTQPHDRRVTPVGRLLRRTSLDELPQFFNILAGQMSLVGPRPERPELIADFLRVIPRYALRHQVKAGLTGWAQVHGFRGQTSLRKRLQYDLYYINNWSLWLDLWILAQTALRGFVHPNAY